MCHYCYFLEKNFRIQPKAFHGCFNENHNRYYYKVFLENVEVNSIDILYYDRIEVSEGININNLSASKECIICHYWYFLDKRFKFQPMNLNNITFLNIHCFDYCCITNGISRNNYYHV